MDNTLEHLHEHHQGHHHLHHLMDETLPTAAASSMISYDQPMHHDQQQQQDASMSMMKMYFHFGLGDLVLFPSLVMDSHTKLWLTCAALFLAAILLEMIDYSRGYLSCRCQSQSHTSRRVKSASSTASSETGLVDTTSSGAGPQSPSAHHRQPWNCCAGPAPGTPTQAGSAPAGHHDQGYGTWRKEYFEPKFFPVRTDEPQLYRLLQAGLQFVRTGLSLCLMLVAMTYNVCLIFAILLGSAVGYYIFYRPALDSKSVVCH